MIIGKTSEDLFNKIRSKFSNLQLGDSTGATTANPKEAVFFDFEFTEDADTFGRISISIADGENMKVFYNKGLVEKIDEDSRENWYNFLKELKDFAMEHQLSFDVRDINKTSLTQQDFKNLADQNKTVNTDGMSEELSRITKLAGLAEGLTGTSKSSFENLDKTRLIIRHSKPVAEEVPGARTRHINSLYVENSDGERFKYPIVHLAGARAMARHVANGGLPHDEFGEHIVNTSEQIAQLNSFNRYVSTKDQLNDSAGDIIERAKMKCETLKKYIKGLSKQKNYESAKESFQPSNIPALDDETKSSLRDKFTLKHFDEKIDTALPLINSIMKETEEVTEFDDEKPLSKKDIEIPAPVDGGNETLAFLNSGSPLILKRDPGAEQIAFRSEFKEKKDKLRAILMDIADRMLPVTPESDKVANFASAMANDLSKIGDPFGDVSNPNFKRDLSVAYKLAIRYMQDIEKMRKDPEYANVIRKEPQEIKAKVDRQGRAKESIEQTFENWADNIVEQKPYVSMYRGDDGKMVYDVLDKDGESAMQSPDYDVATAYLKKNFDRLAGKQPAMDDVNENPETDYNGSFEYELYGDDGESAYGTIHYKAVNGKVDPKSLHGEYEYEGNAKVDSDLATQMVQPGGDEHEEALKAAQEDYDYEAQRMQSKFGEGNEFAQAVNKAKAAGMKPGDKFEVGGKEYTLKDAIEQAGLQLEEFFSEAEYAEPSQEHYKKALAAGFKGSYEDYKKEYASFPEEFPKNEASKPDFLDMDKDGDKTEPMKSAAKDAKKESTELDSIIKLAGI